jgi:hypothetical protein
MNFIGHHKLAGDIPNPNPTHQGYSLQERHPKGFEACYGQRRIDTKHRLACHLAPNPITQTQVVL